MMFSDSDGYERFMGRWSRRLALPFLAFAEVDDGCTLLDVGCGTGALASAATDIDGVTVTGVDPSDTFIEVARQRSRDGSVRFVTGAAEDLPFGADTFDRTLSMLVLNFVAEPARALAEMIRVTRPGGVIAGAVWDYGDGMGMLRAFWDEACEIAPGAEERDERRMPLCRPGELAGLWRGHGLRAVTERPLTIDLEFTSFDDYWQPFESGQGPAGTMTRSLSPSQRDDLRARLRQRLVGDADRSFTLPARAWAVRGTV